MQHDPDWLNYVQALKNLPSALRWWLVSLVCKIDFIHKKVPEKHLFKIASADSTLSTCIYDLVDYRNHYSKYTYTIFCGLVVGLVLVVF